jgi:hypothetical protein
MLSADFLAQLKLLTEEEWSEQAINPLIYGFQFQRGTRWNPGLSEREIAEYENALGVRFPTDFRAFLGAMNGTDLPTLNVYGYCGEPQRQSVGVYSYPRDLEIVRQRIDDVRGWRAELTITLADEGFNFADDESLVPIYGHRYVVCTSHFNRSVVLSIADGSDAIVYGKSLKEYLQCEFLDAAIP